MNFFFFFKNGNCTVDKKKGFLSHLLARFPGDYEDLLIHTVGSLVAMPMIQMMEEKIAADSQGFLSMIPKQHFAVAIDFVQLIELQQLQPVPVVVAAAAAVVDSPVDFCYDENAFFPYNLDHGWDGDVR